jgi:hypothetical protein
VGGPVFAVKHIHFKYWPSQFKKHDKIVISLWKRHLWITWRHLLFKVQYRVQPPRAWMTALTLRLIPPVRRWMSCCDSCFHSRCNAASNWQMFCTGGSRACIRWPNMSQICSGIQIRAQNWPRNRSHGFALEVGSYCSWTMRPGVVIHIHRPCS